MGLVLSIGGLCLVASGVPPPNAPPTDADMVVACDAMAMSAPPHALNVPDSANGGATSNGGTQPAVTSAPAPAPSEKAGQSGRLWARKSSREQFPSAGEMADVMRLTPATENPSAI